jgi:hypothetical protein
MTSANKRPYNEYAEGIVSLVSSAKYPRLQSEVQERMADPPTEDVIRTIVRNLPPQAVEDMLVSAASRDITLLNEFKKLGADLANIYPSTFTFLGYPQTLGISTTKTRCCLHDSPGRCV